MLRLIATHIPAFSTIYLYCIVLMVGFAVGVGVGIMTWSHRRVRGLFGSPNMEDTPYIPKGTASDAGGALLASSPFLAIPVALVTWAIWHLF